MATGHVFLATTLDGFMARNDNRLDWLRRQNTQGEDRGFADYMASVDGLVMGRVTYETALEVHEEWPYPKPVVVMSRSLSQSDVPPHLAGKVEVSALEPVVLIQEFEKRGWSRVSVDGGQVIRAFLPTPVRLTSGPPRKCGRPKPTLPVT